MFAPMERSARRVPLRALLLSVAALAVPVAGALFFPRSLGAYSALLWLLALVPAFLLAYYRGWKGVATALAAGMATLSLTQAAALLLELPIPDLLLGVVVAYLGINLGIGWLAEVFLEDVREVEDLAYTDLLTGLPNRRHARSALEAEFAAAERGRRLSVVLFDLDRFKEYNDLHGHAAGDEALVEFGRILEETTREMNLSARFGGEEFLSVLSGSDGEGGVVFADRVREGLREARLRDGPLTLSAGVAAYHPRMRSPDELLAAADHALYQAKQDGRNSVRLFSPSLLGEILPPEADPAETLPPDQAPEEYPRAPEEVGKTPPPVTLLPHQITGYGAGRTVLLVESDSQARNLIATYLNREGFSVTEVATPEEASRELRREYDVVVTGLRHPGTSGTDLVASVRSRWPSTPVVVMTAVKDANVAADALKAGAHRYLFKPFSMSELRIHLEDALERRDREKEGRTPVGETDLEAKERTEEARRVTLDGVRSLAAAVEIRDPCTRGHASQVWRYARVLADLADPDEKIFPRESLRLACQLHDVGKLGVPATILNKEGPLDPEELREVRRHPGTGRRILEPFLDNETVLAVVTWHHERWDGTGYPDGLVGESIPLSARLVAVANALDAMTSPRAYRPALDWGDAVEEVRELAGVQFDPGLMDTFEAALPRLRKRYREGDGRKAPEKDAGDARPDPGR